MNEPTIQQAGAVPFRLVERGLEFCLITSASGKRWGFPKGIIDPGETAEQTALKETWEEAGVSGSLVGEPLGHYEYEKWDTTLRVVVFLLRAEKVEGNWPEAATRTRQWVEADAARQLLDREPLLRLLGLAIEAIERQD